MTIDQISLFYKEGTSDKVYHLQIIQGDAGYVVNFQHGRRGGALQGGTKTKAAVSLAKARSVFEAIVKEKLGKGYEPGASTNSGVVTPNIALAATAAQPSIVAAAAAKKAARASGVLPQLLNAVTQDEAGSYLDDPNWVMQQKFDGRRMLVKVGAKGEIAGINRKGETVSLSQGVAEELLALGKQHFILDGEAIGDKLFVFDLLEYRGGDIRDLPLTNRYKYLTDLLSQNSNVILAPLYTSAQDKRVTFEALRASGAEGVVFKRADSRYVPGRPASGGSALKVKFWQTASVLVQAVNDKRSVAMALLDAHGRMTSVGNVTILPNQTIPIPGAILEVRYLYAYQGGSLFQPTSKGVRDDIERTDCTLSQLIYKTVDEEELSPTPG
jgi:bifunctional non-homologous end joining protein LigD